MPEFTSAQIAALLRKLAHAMPSDLMGNGHDEPCDETRLRAEIEAAAVQLESAAPISDVKLLRRASDAMLHSTHAEAGELVGELRHRASAIEATKDRLFTGEEVETLLSDNIVSANGYRSLNDRAAALVRAVPVLTEETLEVKIVSASRYLAGVRGTAASNFQIARQMLDLVGVRG